MFAPSRGFSDRICLELSLSGQQRLQDIRDRISVPRTVSFGPAAPSRYSKQGFGPSNCFFRASSAFKIFEAGLWSLELLLSGQQRLQDIRSRTSVPRIVSFGPAAPSRYSRRGFSPSNCFLGQQYLQIVRGRVSILRIAFFGLVMLSKNSSSSCRPSNHPFRVFLLSYQRSSFNMPESWWQYTSLDAVCQIRR
jgi:hypothetical protein